MNQTISPDVRAKLIYPVLGPLGTVLSLYGVVGEAKWAALTGLITVLIPLITAFVYRPTPEALDKLENAAVANFTSRTLQGQIGHESGLVPEEPAPEGVDPYEGD